MVTIDEAAISPDSVKTPIIQIRSPSVAKRLLNEKHTMLSMSQECHYWPYFGRVTYDECWMGSPAKVSANDETLNVNLLSNSYLVELILQGHPTENWFVDRLKIEYSSDGINWKPHPVGELIADKEHGQMKVFVDWIDFKNKSLISKNRDNMSDSSEDIEQYFLGSAETLHEAKLLAERKKCNVFSWYYSETEAIPLLEKEIEHLKEMDASKTELEEREAKLKELTSPDRKVYGWRKETEELRKLRGCHHWKSDDKTVLYTGVLDDDNYRKRQDVGNDVFAYARSWSFSIYPPVKAQYYRLRPVSYVGMPALRMEMIGCRVKKAPFMFLIDDIKAGIRTAQAFKVLDEKDAKSVKLVKPNKVFCMDVDRLMEEIVFAQCLEDIPHLNKFQGMQETVEGYGEIVYIFTARKGRTENV
eukprot:UN34325